MQIYYFYTYAVILFKKSFTIHFVIKLLISTFVIIFNQQMDLSIIIPLFNEKDSLNELFNRINKVCTEHQYTYEVWFVDDGSTDSSWEIIEHIFSDKILIDGKLPSVGIVTLNLEQKTNILNRCFTHAEEGGVEN